MDQSALEALLNQLKQRDGPDDFAETKHAGDDDIPSLAIEDAVDIDGADEAEAEVNRQINDEENDVSAAASNAGGVSAIDEPSQLDILLKSLRPVEDDGRAGIEEEEGQLDLPYGAAYLDILNCVRSSTTSAVTTEPPPSSVQDIRKFTFAQALPVLSRLAADPTFMEALQQLKSQQELLELNIVDERNRAKADLEKQLKIAKQSASIAGRKYDYEVDRIDKLLTSRITKYDKAALVRWDAAAREQQARLEQLGVPCFYVLKMPDKVAQERQRRVMDMLHQLLEDS